MSDKVLTLYSSVKSTFTSQLLYKPYFCITSITMAPQELKGILVALITPFTDDGTKVHEGRLEQHINRMIDAGIHGNTFIYIDI